jgi:hypothetical protein
MRMNLLVAFGVITVGGLAMVCERRALAEGAACPQACNTTANCEETQCIRTKLATPPGTPQVWVCHKTKPIATPGKVCGDKKEGETEGCKNDKAVKCGETWLQSCPTSVDCSSITKQSDTEMNGCVP